MEPKPGMTKTAQVAEYMERKIASGEWDISQPIPSLNDLAGECGVSFGTVRAAQQILVDKGLLAEPEQGIPTRVIARPAPLDARDALALVRTTYRSLGEQLERLAAAADPDASTPAIDLRHLGTHQVHDYARFTAAAAALAHGYRDVHVAGPQTRLLIDDRIAPSSKTPSPSSSSTSPATIPTSTSPQPSGSATTSNATTTPGCKARAVSGRETPQPTTTPSNSTASGSGTSAGTS
jgi:DNA-binding transcriptional regulator YhcF (GntR family)